MKKVLLITGALVLSFALSIGSCLIFAYPTMLLWNWLLPIISKGFIPTLTFWQMFGLMTLLRLLIPVSSGSSKD